MYSENAKVLGADKTVSLDESIRNERNELLVQFPDYREKILNYVGQVSEVVNQLMEGAANAGQVAQIEEICGFLDRLHRQYLHEFFSPEIGLAINRVRRSIRSGVLCGRIVLGPVTVPTRGRGSHPSSFGKAEQP